MLLSLEELRQQQVHEEEVAEVVGCHRHLKAVLRQRPVAEHDPSVQDEPVYCQPLGREQLDKLPHRLKRREVQGDEEELVLGDCHLRFPSALQQLLHGVACAPLAAAGEDDLRACTGQCLGGLEADPGVAARDHNRLAAQTARRQVADGSADHVPPREDNDDDIKHDGRETPSEVPHAPYSQQGGQQQCQNRTRKQHDQVPVQHRPLQEGVLKAEHEEDVPEGGDPAHVQHRLRNGRHRRDGCHAHGRSHGYVVVCAAPLMARGQVEGHSLQERLSDGAFARGRAEAGAHRWRARVAHNCRHRAAAPHGMESHSGRLQAGVQKSPRSA
mmetsp:Transcript_59175/g.152217  ORF Transcript_59175/g.152217 Transcript_59175/m.152217 type:complete len:328 (+) Transcript_59175:613-1596(+)